MSLEDLASFAMQNWVAITTHSVSVGKVERFSKLGKQSKTLRLEVEG